MENANNIRKRIALPIIVEGRYDKSVISSLFDATVITTGGFSVFNSKEKQALIRKLAERGGVILLTDSDGGGIQIRSFLSGIIPKDKLYHIYIPRIEGKEKRKKSRSKAGFLGVEGMEREVLEKLLSPFISDGACNENKQKSEEKILTKLDFFKDGLSGGDSSSLMRARLAKRLGLPPDMSAKAMIEAINLLYGYSEYEKIRDELFSSF